MKKVSWGYVLIGIMNIVLSVIGAFVSLDGFKGYNLPFQLLVISLNWGSIAVPKLTFLINILSMPLFDYFLSIILIISGIGIIVVKRWGKIFAYIYAMSIISLSLISVLCIPIYIWKLTMLAVNRWEPIIQLDWFKYVGGGITCILMFLGALLYPIILLIFFSRPKVKEKFTIKK